MASVLNVENIEQFRQFLNEKGILEIALRNQNKKFTAFQKIAINNISKGEEKELLNKAIGLMNKNNAIAEKSISVMNNVAKLQQLSFILSGLNLCATCVGFAIMYAKLDKVSGQMNKLLNVVKQGNGVQADYEFKKVISEHSNMLDSRKTQKYYSEEQMRKLVDDEYNVLNLLIDIFMKDLADDADEMIFSIYSLASMLAVSLRYFDELYYFNNKEAIGNGDVWHSSHNSWMSVFERMKDVSFVKKIQDHGIFDLRLSTVENDVYYISLSEQVAELIEDVVDNQELILALDNREMIADVSELIRQNVANSIREAFESTEGALQNPNVKKVYEDAINQVALAV